MAASAQSLVDIAPAPAPEADDTLTLSDTTTTTVEQPWHDASQTSHLLTSAALADEQAARDRVSLRTALGVAVVAALALQLAETKTASHWVLTASLALLAFAHSAILIESRGARTIDPSRLLATSVLSVTICLAAIVHVGVVSPVTGFLIMIVYYKGTTTARIDPPLIYGLAAAGYLAIMVLVFTGVIPQRQAIISITDDDPKLVIAITIVVEALLFATYQMARRTREATLSAMARLDRASQHIRAREALLLEARADLEGARAVGRTGSHTGRRVGAYQVGLVIGRGAAGDVYQATDVETRQRVALKVLHSHLLEDPTHRARFAREAEIAMKLDSPHLARVFSRGTTHDGAPFVAMELLDGVDLADHLRERRRLDLDVAVEMATQVALGLNAAQECGVVHRDLKPQNVFLCADRRRDRSWKVLDFGVAAIREASIELSRGSAVGTPSYMSPEQTRGAIVDHRSDVFSLGAIVYRCITGQPAFPAADHVATMYRVNYVQPTKPSTLSKAPADVDAVLAIALAKDKHRRFHSATTFAAALRDAARGELDEPFREAARAILSEHGWGQDAG